MTYAQPPLALLEAPTAPTWKSVADRLADSGLQLARQPQAHKGAMQSHTGKWWDAATRPDGTRVSVQVHHYRRVLRWRWQVSAYAYAPGHHHREDRLELLDPTPVQAHAALDLLTGPPAARWRDVLTALASRGVHLAREPRIMAEFTEKWTAEAVLSDGSRVDLDAYRYPLRWSLHGSVSRPEGGRGLVVLRDATPGHALAALVVLGLDGGESHG